MAKNTISKISNAFATGGGGVNFEQQIQAMFLLSLLIDGFCPAMEEQTTRVCFQAKHLGYDVDDLAVFTVRKQGEGKLLCQVKHSITATQNDSVFQQVISAAWCDFNKEAFDKEKDRIALVTAQISNLALRSLRFLHSQAIGSIDAQEFIERVQTPAFANAESGKMLNALKYCVALAKKSDPSDTEMWRFCKVFILLLFDVDYEESVNRALSSSLIKCNSTMDALSVWARLVEYAGRCNQAAASISRDNIDKAIQELFTMKYAKQKTPEPIAKIDLFIPTIAIIGAWREDNTFDRKAIEKISGIGYSEFEAKARNMLLQDPDYLQLLNGNWCVLHKEELLSQCKEAYFDDFIGRLFDVVKSVLSQSSKRVTSNTPYYISSGSEYDNSYELRSSLIKSICWLKENLNALSNCNRSKTEGYMSCLVRDLLDNAKWTTWASLRDCLQNLAQIAPGVFLDRVEWNLLHKKQEFLCLFPQKNSDIFQSNNYISELLWSLEVLAWSPDYLIKSVCTLGLLEDLPYERTNWANTPINSIVSILLPWYPQTLANLEKRKNALKSLRNDNPEIFWKVLKKLLPNHTTSTSDNPNPQYMSLNIPEKIAITNAEVSECYAYLLELAVETVRKDAEKQLDLVDQIGYMHEQTLSAYLDCLEDSLETYTQECAFTLWIQLRERLVLIKPAEGMVIYRQLDRIKQLIDKLEPEDKRLKYKELYLGKRFLFEKGDYATIWERMESEKAVAIKEIYDIFGIEETEQFGYSVKNLHDVASKLGRTLTADELSGLIDACSLGKVSQEFSASCVATFVFVNGADSLLSTSLRDMNKEFILSILTKIPFTMQLQNVIEKFLPDDSAYWERARMPFSCIHDEADELKLIVEKLIACKRYVTATNIIGRSDFDAIFSAEYLYDLLRLAGTEASVGSEDLDDYAVQKIIGWLQNQESIDLNMRSDIEFIYLPVLDSYSEVQPHALNTRLSLDPDYFCSMLELFFKKRSEENHEVELNKGLSERLYKILFNYNVTPGIDWNGVFSAAKFKKWIDYVKTWSKQNDRYAVAMHTVGSGLSFAKLDEEKLPDVAIIEELNKPENSELRRGYYLGVINQRGVHWVDPEGKTEKELAADYLERANIAESKGFARFASTLREISGEYVREAEQNIEESNKDIE